MPWTHIDIHMTTPTTYYLHRHCIGNDNIILHNALLLTTNTNYSATTNICIAPVVSLYRYALDYISI